MVKNGTIVALKLNLSALQKGITSNHGGDFYCINCFKAFRIKSKFEIHKIESN